MSKFREDRGPVVAFAVPAVEGAIPNIGLTIQDRSGPIMVLAGVEITNPAANVPTVTARIARNGVAIAASDQIMIMVASTRIMMILFFSERNPTVGDIFTLRLSTNAAAAGHEVAAGRAFLYIVGEARDDAFVAGISTPTA